ncbi:MAG TPA: DUF6502 family protein [Steroidobacteraceae bacterium]|jgi:hypothetical protein|nr:DUF6502 family protein [Steroidobacteraceae bacterium]
MESGGLKALILTSCRTLLVPIARLLLKSGVTWKEFCEVARRTFVHVATAEFGIRGRPTNVSRVAILTGMTRREVRRQRDLLESDPQPEAGYMSKASRVLSGWHQDRDFIDANSEPRALEIDAGGLSFAELARRYGGDIPPGALLKELQSGDAIERLPDGRIRATKRVFLPRQMEPAQVRLWASALLDMGTTLEHNLTRDKVNAPRFERRALSLRVDRRALPAFRQFLENEGQAFLERIDEWLTQHQAGAEDAESAIRLGAGVYHIEEIPLRGRTK